MSGDVMYKCVIDECTSIERRIYMHQLDIHHHYCLDQYQKKTR